MSDVRDAISVYPAIAPLAAPIAALHAANFQDAWPESYWRQQIADPDVKVFVAAAGNGPPIGVALVRQVADEAEILSLAVSPAHRRQGIAQRLLDHLMSDLSAEETRRILLEVSVENHAAIALYKRNAFKQVGLRKSYYRRSGGPIDAKVLAREIASCALR